ncbi:MAG: hypothetical protein K0R57_3796 [Paenibacillaceae bacterium]|jgi:hypothetical protein|nr:hypothetical protein [Paenibacillaceae bacterium]
MKSKELDEMQLARRNHIGNQSFMLLSYLLLLDVVLYDFGVEWLKYPVREFVIMLVCQAYYLIRVVKAGAYGRSGKKAGSKVIGAVVASATAAFVISAYLGKWRQEETQGGGALLLLCISAVVLVLCFILMKWNERKNDRGED